MSASKLGEMRFPRTEFPLSFFADGDYAQRVEFRFNFEKKIIEIWERDKK